MKSSFQNIIFPCNDLRVSHDLYARLPDSNAFFNIANNEVNIIKGGYASFDTFFNAFSLSKVAKYIKFSTLYLNLGVRGKGILKIFHARLGVEQSQIGEQVFLCDERSDIEVNIQLHNVVREGIVFFKIEALEDVDIYSGQWSIDAVRSPVNLGIVVTHFNRQKYLLPAVERIRNNLFNDVEYKDSIKLVIVDNSQNLEIEQDDNVVVLSNDNLGGSGGFTRGLLYLKDNGFTHCLFMDDDASCEVDSIKRAYNFLAYSSSDCNALAGSLLREIESYRLFEKGARFDGICRPLKSGLDMRSQHDLLFAEVNAVKVDYGGWWFFAFNISYVKHFPFPFFVRGDDIQFSLLNNFEIVTMNGVNCWGDDFGYKSGPLPIYLDVRNHLVQKLVVLKSSCLSSAILAARFFFAAALSYNYATAKAVTLAVRDVAKGRDFWVENMDMALIRKEILSFSDGEKMQEIDRSALNIVYRNPFESVLRKVVRLLTINGFLLPSFFIRDSVAFQHKNFRGSLREIFRFKYVLYEYEPLKVGYVAVHDKKQFMQCCKDFFITLMHFVSKYNELQKGYDVILSEFTTEVWWRNVYSKIRNHSI